MTKRRDFQTALAMNLYHAVAIPCLAVTMVAACGCRPNTSGTEDSKPQAPTPQRPVDNVSPQPTPTTASPSTPSERTSQTPSQPTLFTDITASSGLDFQHFNGATGTYRFPEIMGAGCALWDYDNDGDLDIYAIQGAPLAPGEPLFGPPPDNGRPMNRLYRNDSELDGTNQAPIHFTDVTESSGLGDLGYGMGCAVGDYDNDGFADIYVTNYGSNALYHNNGDGTFTNVTATAGVDDPRWSTSAAFVDYEQDGFLDLVVTNYVQYTPETTKQCVSFHTGAPDYCVPSEFPPAPDSLFRNRGDGTFEDATSTAGLSGTYGAGLGVVCADFNNDQRIDIYVANDATPNQLWTNLGNGTFRDEGLLAGTAYNSEGKVEGGMGVLAEDFDADGDLDIFLTHFKDESNTLYANQVSAQGILYFDDHSFVSGLGFASLPMTGFGTAAIDYDNDGDQDLFVANGAVLAMESQFGEPFPYALENQLFRNSGGAFELVDPGPEGSWRGWAVGRGTAMGDIDNDGDMDLLISNNNGPLQLLRNNLGQDAHWVAFQLAGSSGNRDALGAEIYLERADGSVLRRRVARDGSYCSANDPRVYFGLGQEESINSVTVLWPGGSKERWTDVGLNKQSQLVEGQGQPVAQ